MPVPVSTSLGSPLRGSSPDALPGPPAARLRRPSWRDTRLIVGVLLVLGSMVTGARVMAAADDSIAVWAAARPLPVGATLTVDDLVQRRVRMSAGEDLYLPAGPLPERGAVLLRAVGEGELLPRAALGDAARLRLRPVVVVASGPVPSGLGPGARVDVWVATRSPSGPGGSGDFGTPDRLVRSAEVTGVRQDKGAFSSGERSVEILVAEDVLPRLLAALANGASVTLTPLPGGGG
ncbi:MAG: hypothetical protein U0Q15_17640 [Kineosporiaceae bacterium]